MLTGRALIWLDPLARPHRCPHALQESKTASSCVAAVVTTHNRPNCLGRFIGVVEGDGADVVVEDVGLDDTMQELATDETKFTINRSGCTTSVVPGVRSVVRQAGIGVLEVGNGQLFLNVSTRNGEIQREPRAYLASD